MSHFTTSTYYNESCQGQLSGQLIDLGGLGGKDWCCQEIRNWRLGRLSSVVTSTLKMKMLEERMPDVGLADFYSLRMNSSYKVGISRLDIP